MKDQSRMNQYIQISKYWEQKRSVRVEILSVRYEDKLFCNQINMVLFRKLILPTACLQQSWEG